MLNEVHVEGIIIARWRYGGTQFLRLAVYSDPSRGVRRDENYGRNLPDYVIARCEGVYALVAANLPDRARVSISGRLISRQHEATLDTFLKRARGDEKTLKALRAQTGIHAINVSYVINEVLVERLELLTVSSRNGQHGATAAAPEAAPVVITLPDATNTGANVTTATDSLTTATPTSSAPITVEPMEASAEPVA